MADEVTKVEEVKEEVKEEVVEKQTPKTFTQDEVNALNAKAKEAERKAMLKELGVEDFDNAKEGFAAWKKEQDAKKSELEKAQEALKEKELSIEAEKKEKESIKAQLSAIKMGIDAEKVEKAVKLASSYDGDTAEDKLKALLDDLGEDVFKSKPKLDKFGNKVKNQQTNVDDDLTELFKKELTR